MEHLYPPLQEPFQAYLATLSEPKREQYLAELLACKSRGKCSACGIPGHIRTNRLCPVKQMTQTSGITVSSAAMSTPVSPPAPPSISVILPPTPRSPTIPVIPSSLSQLSSLGKPNIISLPGKPYSPGEWEGGVTVAPKIPKPSTLPMIGSGPIGVINDSVPSRRNKTELVIPDRIVTREMARDAALTQLLESFTEDIYPDVLALARNDSWLDIMQRENLYLAYCDYLQYAITVFPDIFERDDRALYLALERQNHQALYYSSMDEATGMIHQRIMEVFAMIPERSTSAASSTAPAIPPRYMSVMSALTFQEAPLELAQHTYHESLVNKPSRAQLTRVGRELATLSTSLPISDTASCIVRVSNIRMDYLSFMLTGPIGTPYAYGCFIFDMYLSPNYPNTPPQCRLRTTANGRVRFNPNLYNTGKVCLSLLGTWTGPGWDPKHSTILQVINSLQALVLVDEPWYNEPGRKYVKNNPKSLQYNLEILRNTIRHAINDHLTRIHSGVPSYESVFDEAIIAHLRLHKESILEHAARVDIPAEEMHLLATL